MGSELRRARAQEASIRQTIMESELPSELTSDVDALVTAFEATARRADIIYRTLERQQENGQGADALAARIDQLSRSGRTSDDDKALVSRTDGPACRRPPRRGAARPLLHDDGADGGRARNDRLGDPRDVRVRGGVIPAQVAGQLQDLRELVSGLAGDMQRSQSAAADLPAV